VFLAHKNPGPNNNKDNSITTTSVNNYNKQHETHERSRRKTERENITTDNAVEQTPFMNK
jgi:hypothetical protein